MNTSSPVSPGTRLAEESYPFHHRSEVDVDADPRRLYALLDDHRRLASHMEKPSLMMAGASMRVEMDEQQGQAVGSVIRIAGKVLGLKLIVEELITERVPPSHKTWETRGEPHLLVIGAYRMGFSISPLARRSHLMIFIDYRIPSRGLPRVFGLLLGKTYAQWCTRRMAADAAAAFKGADDRSI